MSGVHLRVLTVGLGRRGAAQIARPLTEVDHALRQLLLVLLAVGGVGILVAAVLGGVVARAALAPVSRFTRRTEALTANPDLSQRLEIEGQDELARLARSFNATLDALERSAEAQRHLVADASHELRTPIASLRANIQVLQDADLLPEADRESLRADIIAELDELTALVGDVVELARGAKPSDVVDDVRIDQIVRALVERAERRAGDGVVFRSTPAADRRQRRARAHQPRDLEPARQRAQVEPARRADRDRPGRRHAHRSATTGRASTRPTSRTSSTASTAPTARAGCPARASGWPSCGRRPRRTAAG